MNDDYSDVLNPMLDCPYHGYSERSARDKLTRHLARGETDWRIWWHGYCNQWHVEPEARYREARGL